MNDVLVLYIDTGVGGFTNTSGFADNSGTLQSAVSGYSSSGRSVLTMSPGFAPDYAIALGPTAGPGGGLWRLANGGSGSLIFSNSINLTPLNTATAYAYAFSFDVRDIGLTPKSGATFKLFGTYVSNTGYRSTEAVAGNDTGTQGWNPFSNTATSSYTIQAIFSNR